MNQINFQQAADLHTSIDDLERELNLLTAKHALLGFPHNVDLLKRMGEIFKALHELTKDHKYKVD